MSDSRPEYGGDDWWQANDGKWYPPERHPSYVPSSPPQPPPYTPSSATDRTEPAVTGTASFTVRPKWSKGQLLTLAAVAVGTLVAGFGIGAAISGGGSADRETAEATTTSDPCPPDELMSDSGCVPFESLTTLPSDTTTSSTTTTAAPVTEAPAPTPPPTTAAPPPPPPPTAPPESVSQSNARRKAESYLEFSAFSRSGLIEQLEFEGFSNGDATYGVDSLNTDWNQQAAAKAASYLEFSSFSRSGLIEQLLFEGFTPEQAEFGVNSTGL